MLMWFNDPDQPGNQPQPDHTRPGRNQPDHTRLARANPDRQLGHRSRLTSARPISPHAPSRRMPYLAGPWPTPANRPRLSNRLCESPGKCGRSIRSIRTPGGEEASDVF